MWVHADYIVSVALQKLLLPSVGVFANKNATSTVVDVVILKNEVGVVQRGERKGAV